MKGKRLEVLRLRSGLKADRNSAQNDTRKKAPVGILSAVLFLAVLAHTSAEPAPEPVPKSSPAISAEAKQAADAALSAFSNGDMLAARKGFKELLALAPDNLTGLVNLGSVEYRLKNSEDAEKLLKRAVRIDPDAAPAWLTLGVIYYDQDKPDAALAALSRAVLLDPKNPRAHNYLAVAIGRKGWFDGAESELQRALELDPDYAEAHFNLAVIYLKRSSPPIELARRHYQKALDLGAARDPLVEKELARTDATGK